MVMMVMEEFKCQLHSTYTRVTLVFIYNDDMLSAFTPHDSALVSMAIQYTKLKIGMDLRHNIHCREISIAQDIPRLSTYSPE